MNIWKIGVMMCILIVCSVGVYADPPAYVGGNANVCGNRFCELGENPANCPQDCESYRVFVSSQTYNGFLSTVDGADMRCQDISNSRGLGGVWKAYLGNSTDSAGSRLFHSSVPYRMLNGTMVAQSWSDLTDGSLIVPLDIDEYGNDVGSVSVWTGSKPWNERGKFDTCEEWLSAADTSGPINVRGIVGSTANWSLNPQGQQEPGRWEGYYYSACSVQNHLYCIEQPNVSITNQSFCTTQQVQCDFTGDYIDQTPTCCGLTEMCTYNNYSNGLQPNGCQPECNSLEHLCPGSDGGLCCSNDVYCDTDTFGRAACGAHVPVSQVSYSPPGDSDTLPIQYCSDYDKVDEANREFSCNDDGNRPEEERAATKELSLFSERYPEYSFDDATCIWQGGSCVFSFKATKEGNWATCTKKFTREDVCGKENQFHKVYYEFIGSTGSVCEELNDACGADGCSKEVPCPRAVEMPFFGTREFFVAAFIVVIGYIIVSIVRKKSRAPHHGKNTSSPRKKGSTRRFK